jgi:hypothetical protein
MDNVESCKLENESGSAVNSRFDKDNVEIKVKFPNESGSENSLTPFKLTEVSEDKLPKLEGKAVKSTLLSNIKEVNPRLLGIMLRSVNKLLDRSKYFKLGVLVRLRVPLNRFPETYMLNKLGDETDGNDVSMFEAKYRDVNADNRLRETGSEDNEL